MGRRGSPHRGFTFVEAMVALSITGIAAGALLSTASTIVQSTDNDYRSFVAAGIAQQVMDEIAGKRYYEPTADPYQWPFSANATELAGPGRSKFNDIDDFVSYVEAPPKDRTGQALGNENGDGNARDPRFRIPSAFFTRWRLETTLFYAGEGALNTSLSSGTTSDFRTVQVKARYNDPTRGYLDLANYYGTFTYVTEP